MRELTFILDNINILAASCFKIGPPYLGKIVPNKETQRSIRTGEHAQTYFFVEKGAETALHRFAPPCLFSFPQFFFPFPFFFFFSAFALFAFLRFTTLIEELNRPAILKIFSSVPVDEKTRGQSRYITPMTKDTSPLEKERLKGGWGGGGLVSQLFVQMGPLQICLTLGTKP